MSSIACFTGHGPTPTGRMTPDELLVLSFPGPDRSIRLEELQAGRAVSRRYRNRRIGEFLKELDLTEGRSTGVPKMLRVMRQNGSPVPVFETDDDRSYFLIRLPVHVGFQPDAASTPEVTPEVRLCLAIRGQMSRAELQALMQLKDAEHFRKAFLLPALEAGYIAMTIPDKPSSSKQRYYLTDAGKALIDGIPKTL